MQRASVDHRSEKEIAVGRIVHAVGRNAARDGLAIDLRIHLGRVRRGDHNRVAVEISAGKGTLDPFKLAFKSELPNLRICRGRNDAQLRAGLEQACDLVERYGASADDKRAATVEFEKNR